MKCNHPLASRQDLDGRTLSPSDTVIKMMWQWCQRCGSLRDRDGMWYYSQTYEGRES